jgi:hypothetical protein
MNGWSFFALACFIVAAIFAATSMICSDIETISRKLSAHPVQIDGRTMTLDRETWDAIIQYEHGKKVVYVREGGK